MRRVLLCLLTLVTCDAGLGSQPCPWLNSATAAGFLGGPVTARLSASKHSQACEFTSQSKPASKLWIAVSPMPSVAGWSIASALRCDKANIKPIASIGSEAALCVVSRRDRVTVRLMGRVRDQVFSIRLGFTAEPGNRQAWQDAATSIADQVAGGLF